MTSGSGSRIARGRLPFSRRRRQRSGGGSDELHERHGRAIPVERTAGGTSLLDVVDRVLDKGIVIDAWIKAYSPRGGIGAWEGGVSA